MFEAVERFYRTACAERFDVTMLADFPNATLHGFDCVRCGDYHVTSKKNYMTAVAALKGKPGLNQFKAEVIESPVTLRYATEIIHYYGSEALAELREKQQAELKKFSELVCAGYYEKNAENVRSYEIECLLHGFHLISKSQFNDFRKVYKVSSHVKKACRTHTNVQAVTAAVTYQLEKLDPDITEFIKVRPHDRNSSCSQPKRRDNYIIPPTHTPYELIVEFGTCGRKKKHATEEDAVSKMETHHLNQGYSTYICNFCGSWHYGRKTKKKVTGKTPHSTGMYWYKLDPEKANQFMHWVMTGD